MKATAMIGLFLIALIVTALVYVRFSPGDAARWHVPPDVTRDRTLKGGVKRLVEARPDGLKRLDAIAHTTPRTRVLAGSVDAGMITYISRSRVFGFPDYTTVQQQGTTLKIYGRSRFGRSDFGVNKARVDGWIAALQAR